MAGPRAFWIVATLLLVAVTQGGVAVVRDRYEPRIIREVRRDLQELPSTLGDWKVDEAAGDSIGIDAQVLNRLHATGAMTRMYVHPSGRTVGVHVATWDVPNDWTPHRPDVCYKGAGFTLAGSSSAKLPGYDAVRVGVFQFLAPQSGSDTLTMYWYQLEKKVYTDRDSARAVRQSYWGKRERPPLVKVLMQSNGATEEDEKLLAELAAHVYEFTSTL